MKVQIKNLQKVKKINLSELRKRILRVLKILDLSDKILSFVFCDNDFISQINFEYLKHQGPTNVISFALDDDGPDDTFGEIFVSVSEALTSCQRYENSFDEELMLYVVHGLLHLCGYDDQTPNQKTKMRRKEKEILTQIFD
jgi:probable rRNA maturation factor